MDKKTKDELISYVLSNMDKAVTALKEVENLLKYDTTTINTALLVRKLIDKFYKDTSEIVKKLNK